MKKLLLPLLAALAVAGSGCAGNSSAEDAAARVGAPQFNNGQVKIAGLEMTLDPKVWKEADRNNGKLVLQYQPDGVACERPLDCSQLTLAREVDGQDGDYYILNVEVFEFSTIVFCGAPQDWEGGREELSAAQIGDERFRHFITDPCEGLEAPPRSLAWFSEPRRLVIRFDETLTGVRYEDTDLIAALASATWSDPI